LLSRWEGVLAACPTQRLHPTGLSGRLAKLTEPAAESACRDNEPEPPGG
jgi:hypothetical protein